MKLQQSEYLLQQKQVSIPCFAEKRVLACCGIKVTVTESLLKLIAGQSPPNATLTLRKTLAGDGTTKRIVTVSNDLVIFTKA